MDWRAALTIALKILSSWEVLKETLFQKLLTYHLPPLSSLISKDVSGLNIIVTGATSGIGLHTARELVMAGANIFMACRNVKAAKALVSKWRKEAPNNKIITVEVMELDLSLLSSVRKFADEWERRAEPLHILINNAGISVLGETRKFTHDGIEQHIHVNHVAPALLTLLLLPSLLKASSPRIINVNSVGHYFGVVEPHYWNSRMDRKYSTLEAYGSSKLAHIMFLKVLAAKLIDDGNMSVQCIAVHPGAVCTNLNSLAKIKLFFMLDGDEGARSVVFCATSDSVADNLTKGFAYYSCNCKPGKISEKAEDINACIEVWKKTLEISEVKEDYLSQFSHLSI